MISRTEIADLMQMIADAMLDGDAEMAARFYAMPLVIYRDKDVALKMSREDMITALLVRRDSATSSGAVKVVSELLDLTEQENGRFVASLTWTFLDRSGTVLDQSVMQYFGTQAADSTIQIEIAEFQNIAFSDEGIPFIRKRTH